MNRIEPCQEQAGQRRHRRHTAKVAVHTGGDCLRLSARCGVRGNQPGQISGPHSGCQTFAADVTQGKDYAAARLLDGEKVTGHMANGESFTGNLEVVVPDQARRAEAPVYLRSFDNRRVQVGVILLKCFELQLKVTVA